MSSPDGDWLNFGPCPVRGPSEPVRKFFIAHAKSVTDDALTEMVLSAKRHLEPAAGGQPFEITLGRDYFQERFKACGSWDAWAAEVSTGCDFVTRQPLFKGILVPRGPVGAATAKIIETALNDRKPVYAFDSDRITTVTGVTQTNDKDWKTGWSLLETP